MTPGAFAGALRNRSVRRGSVRQRTDAAADNGAHLDPCRRGDRSDAHGSACWPAGFGVRAGPPGRAAEGIDNGVGGEPAIAGRNRVLAGLPIDVRARLQSRLERVDVAAGTSLNDGSTPLYRMYFPETGIVSLMVTLTDGATIQVAMVGYEGVAALPGLLSSVASPIRAVWKSAGSAWTMELDDFASELQQSPPFRERIQRYSQALYVQLAQSVACGRHHSIDARCVRWLLCCADRVGDQFVLTHESLAQMLGVRRPGVSVATAGLQRAGLIRYQRGRMSIRDRAGLEAVSCECYAIVHAEFEHLLGW